MKTSKRKGLAINFGTPNCRRRTTTPKKKQKQKQKKKKKKKNRAMNTRKKYSGGPGACSYFMICFMSSIYGDCVSRFYLFLLSFRLCSPFFSAFVDWVMSDKKKLDRMQVALEMADKHIGMPAIVSPEDFCNPHIDELSVITYLGGLRQVALKERGEEVPWQNNKPTVRARMMKNMLLIFLSPSGFFVLKNKTTAGAAPRARGAGV